MKIEDKFKKKKKTKENQWIKLFKCSQKGALLTIIERMMQCWKDGTKF